MATSVPAQILGWDRELGTISPGKRADLIAVAGIAKGNEYGGLIEAKERDIELVVINGVRRYGTTRNMASAGGSVEPVRVGDAVRALDLSTDPDSPLARVTLAEATQTLTKVLRDLPELAKQIATEPAAHTTARVAATRTAALDLLELDEIEELNTPVLHRGAAAAAGLPNLLGERVFAAADLLRAMTKPIRPIELDPLTVADDPDYVTQLREQVTLPAGFAEQVAGLY